jgi:hypothetical protein
MTIQGPTVAVPPPVYGPPDSKASIEGASDLTLVLRPDIPVIIAGPVNIPGLTPETVDFEVAPTGLMAAATPNSVTVASEAGVYNVGVPEGLKPGSNLDVTGDRVFFTAHNGMTGTLMIADDRGDVRVIPPESLQTIADSPVIAFPIKGGMGVLTQYLHTDDGNRNTQSSFFNADGTYVGTDPLLGGGNNEIPYDVVTLGDTHYVAFRDEGTQASYILPFTTRITAGEGGQITWYGEAIDIGEKDNVQLQVLDDNTLLAVYEHTNDLGITSVRGDIYIANEDGSLTQMQTIALEQGLNSTTLGVDTSNLTTTSIDDIPTLVLLSRGANSARVSFLSTEALAEGKRQPVIPGVYLDLGDGEYANLSLSIGPNGKLLITGTKDGVPFYMLGSILDRTLYLPMVSKDPHALEEETDFWIPEDYK